MSRGGSKRRYRIRRKRWHENPVVETVGDAAVEVGTNAVLDGAGSLAEAAADSAGGEVVGSFGCCVVEAVCAASVLAALLLVPTFLLLS